MYASSVSSKQQHAGHTPNPTRLSLQARLNQKAVVEPVTPSRPETNSATSSRYERIAQLGGNSATNHPPTTDCSSDEPPRLREVKPVRIGSEEEFSRRKISVHKSAHSSFQARLTQKVQDTEPELPLTPPPSLIKTTSAVQSGRTAPPISALASKATVSLAPSPNIPVPRGLVPPAPALAASVSSPPSTSGRGPTVPPLPATPPQSPEPPKKQLGAKDLRHKIKQLQDAKRQLVAVKSASPSLRTVEDDSSAKIQSGEAIRVTVRNERAIKQQHAAQADGVSDMLVKFESLDMDVDMTDFSSGRQDYAVDHATQQTLPVIAGALPLPIKKGQHSSSALKPKNRMVIQALGGSKAVEKLRLAQDCMPALPTQGKSGNISSSKDCGFCNRPMRLIVCKVCLEKEFFGRVKRDCPQHPNIHFLLDVERCGKCLGTGLKEFEVPPQLAHLVPTNLSKSKRKH